MVDFGTVVVVVFLGAVTVVVTVVVVLGAVVVVVVVAAFTETSLYGFGLSASNIIPITNQSSNLKVKRFGLESLMMSLEYIESESRKAAAKAAKTHKHPYIVEQEDIDTSDIVRTALPKSLAPKHMFWGGTEQSSAKFNQDTP